MYNKDVLMDAMAEAINIGVYILCLFLFFKLHSILEKGLIARNLERGFVVERWSLRLFKAFRNVAILLGSIEKMLVGAPVSKSCLCWFAVVVVGILLRIAAILTLGKYWSYHIEIRCEHEVIRHGVYKYLRHPAYLGNIFIPALYFGLGLTYTPLIAAFFILIFYCYRSFCEDRYLHQLLVSKGGMKVGIS